MHAARPRRPLRRALAHRRRKNNVELPRRSSTAPSSTGASCRSPRTTCPGCSRRSAASCTRSTRCRGCRCSCPSPSLRLSSPLSSLLSPLSPLLSSPLTSPPISSAAAAGADDPQAAAAAGAVVVAADRREARRRLRAQRRDQRPPLRAVADVCARAAAAEHVGADLLLPQERLHDGLRRRPRHRHRAGGARVRAARSNGPSGAAPWLATIGSSGCTSRRRAAAPDSPILGRA